MTLFMVYLFTFPIFKRPLLQEWVIFRDVIRSEAVVVERSDSYRGEQCWDAELRRGLRRSLVRIINDDTRESAHRQKGG